MADPLRVSPFLRTWIRSGLSVLLLDSADRVVELRAGARPDGRNAADPSPKRTPGPASKTGSRTDEKRIAAAKAAPDPAARSARRPERTAADPPAASGGPAGRILPPDAWPPAWQALKNRRPLPPRPLVFWTYAGLGDDLMGTADPVRQKVIVRMLTALRHPGGTHVFWPYALPGDAPTSETGGGDDAPSLFWSGVELLRPRALLLFGSEARDALRMPKSLAPYCQERHGGRLVIQLPAPSALAGDGAGDDAFRQAGAFLARLLRFCSAPRG